MYDYVIIGAGITGTVLARELAKYPVKVALIDKADDIACGATMANSAIIHSGHDPKPGTLKARFNVRGNELYEGLCRELGCAFSRCGALVVACGSDEEKTLDVLFAQATDRNVPVERLTREEALLVEPRLSDGVTAAISLPSTGIITPWEVAIACAEEASLNGVDVKLNREVKGIDRNKDEDGAFFAIDTSRETILTRNVIDAAGVTADAVYAMVSKTQADPEKRRFFITPRRGEYFVLDHTKETVIRTIVYPVPSEKGKGVLVVPTIHNNVLVGPNSDFIDDKEDTGNTAAALADVKRQITKTIRDIPYQNAIRNFAGLRPTGSTHDFIVEEAPDVPGFYLLAAIESPGLTAAPAIAEYVVTELLKEKLPAKKTSAWIARRPFLSLAHMSTEEKNALVKKDPAFGHMVCRCEQITEGEILDAIHRPVGATTLKGVKKRCRPGMGRCQGGFCEPIVTGILSRELSVAPEVLLGVPEEKED